MTTPEDATTPLLSTTQGLTSKRSSHFFFVKSSFKWVLKMVMWVVFIAWCTLMMLYPLEITNELIEKYLKATDTTLFGVTGSLLLAFSVPVFIFSILGVFYLLVSDDEDDPVHGINGEKESKVPKFRLWTFPVLVDGPFGVVSATEFIGILLFYGFVIWAVCAYTVQNWALLSQFQLTAFVKSSVMLELEGLRFGLIGLFCLAFLFIPISRGSVILRLIDIPFEHATKYHVWLGHLTMLLFTLHGLFYVIAWAMQERLVEQILEWKNVGVANLAGVISLGAGLLMWVTSLQLVRKIYFELFFYTHQLYVVFVVFLALHVGDFVFSIAAGGIFIFMLDRFLRFCQSRKTVEIISAKSLNSDTVELVISKPSNLRYNALSFIFLQVRELSLLQWHPFSVSSSPLDGKRHLSVMIKVLGSWTDKLKDRINSSINHENHDQLLHQDKLQSKSDHQMTASVEGPYGHESPYYLKYKHLVLIAGGIGISPFLAILRDILHRVNEGMPCRTRKIQVIWAIKKSNELPVFSLGEMESILQPSLSVALDLQIQIYVTRESESAALEEGKVCYNKATSTSVCPVSDLNGMSVLVGTGDDIWSGAYVIMSIIGFVVILALMDVYYINPFGVYYWWYKGLLFLGCMFVSVVGVGGSVVFLWHLWERRSLAKDGCMDSNFNLVKHNHQEISTENNKNTSEETCGSLQFSSIKYGSRPDFKDIFGSLGEQWGNVNVGVFVCGPPTLQTSVAGEIRSYNLRRRGANQPILHFNSHSFDL